MTSFHARIGRDRSIERILAVGIVSMAAFACRVGPDYERPSLDVPAKFAGSDTGEKESGAEPASANAEPAEKQRLDPEWWKIFGDTELDALQEEALRSNFDLRSASARVVEARAAARAVGSQFYPVISFNPSVTRARLSGSGSSPNSGQGGATVTNLSVPFDLSYEVDVWGRVRRANESAVAQAEASADDFGVVLLTLTADVASNYFTLRSLDAQDETLARSVELYRRQIELTTTQHKAGIVGQTDVLQAQTQLDATIAQEIENRRQRADVEHAIAILTGRPPSELSLAVRKLDLDPPLVPPGLPSDILRQRPDIAEAEHALIAANASIGVAKADFYPALTLTGSAGFDSLSLGHAFDWAGRVWSLGAGLAQPIFEGGKLTAELELAKARYEEAEAGFRSAVLNAIGDVENALTDLHMRSDAIASQRKAVASAREYLRLAEIQYRQGLIGYLVVIDAERTLLTNELTESQLSNQRFVSTVLLIKALGGGWTSENTAETAR